MFRLTSKLVKTPNPVSRLASLRLPAIVGQPITHRTHKVPLPLFASFSTNINRRYNKFEPRIERKLGEYEDYFFGSGREKGWANICSCVLVRSEMELTPEQVRRALANLQRRHAVLRMAVYSKNGENYFAEVPDGPNFEILQATDRKAAVASEEQEWYTFGQLLWRCKLLQPETTDQGFVYPFIFSNHACMFDAMSIFENLFPDLVNYLNSSIDLARDDNIESLPAMPAREYFLDKYRDVDIEPGQQLSQVSSNFDLVPPNDWISNKALAVKLHEMHKPSNPQNCSGLVAFDLDKEQTSKLLKQADKHAVSLNSVCVAAHAMALYRLLIDLGLLTDQGWSLQSPFAVDMKSYAKPEHPASHSGVCVGELSNNITIPANAAGRNGASWELAASIRKETKELFNNPKALLTNIKSFKADFLGLIQEDPEAYARMCEPVQDLFYISMLGNATLPPGKGKVSFDKMELYTGTRNPLMFSHGIHRLNSSRLIHWEICYGKNIVSDELAETYLSFVKKEFERYLLD